MHGKSQCCVWAGFNLRLLLTGRNSVRVDRRQYEPDYQRGRMRGRSAGTVASAILDPELRPTLSSSPACRINRNFPSSSFSTSSNLPAMTSGPTNSASRLPRVAPGSSSSWHPHHSSAKLSATSSSHSNSIMLSYTEDQLPNTSPPSGGEPATRHRFARSVLARRTMNGRSGTRLPRSKWERC